jgi:hypothetical protein
MNIGQDFEIILKMSYLSDPTNFIDFPIPDYYNSTINPNPILNNSTTWRLFNMYS